MKQMILTALIPFLVSPAVFAEGDFVVVAHKSFPVESISSVDVKDVFLGDKTFVDGNVRVRAVRLPDSSDLTTNFVQKYLSMSMDQFLLHWRRRMFSGRGVPPRVVGNQDELAKYVSENQNAVGYLNKGDLSAHKDLKEIKIK